MDEFDSLGYGKRPFYKRVWFWILFIIGAALIVWGVWYANTLEKTENKVVLDKQNPIMKSSTLIIQGPTNADGTLSNKDAKETVLGLGKYTVGKQIPQGIYLAQTTESGSIKVYNNKGEKIQESSMVEKDSKNIMKSLVLLKNGDCLEISGMTNVRFVPYVRDFKTVLNSGIYQVGTDIKQGNYMMEIPSSDGMISVNSLIGMPIFNEILNCQGAQNIKITLSSGDTVMLAGINGVHLVSLDKEIKK
ncbi:hypothetical protein [uncultured Clostridium sp.]|uniref:hypothetical protein n=1 Tax=uncultured Clostridium sp. TaxID=59620 RepID=UPI002628485B|nr:hypothetical protein [uncultured Clostridium sp.]